MTEVDAQPAEPKSAPAPAPPADAGRTRLRTRGHVEDYGEGRGCSHAGCRTVLSRYNSGRLCWVHDNRSRAAIGEGL